MHINVMLIIVGILPLIAKWEARQLSNHYLWDVCVLALRQLAFQKYDMYLYQPCQIHYFYSMQ